MPGRNYLFLFYDFYSFPDDNHDDDYDDNDDCWNSAGGETRA